MEKERNIISLKTKSGDELFGYAWTVKEPKENVIIVTGMEEYALRYDGFAKFLNDHGYNVYCIDQYGQGLNGENGKLGLAPRSFFSKSVKNIDEIVSTCRQSLLPTTLLAHSMGSFMVQDYIQRFTEHINRVVICGSNGPNAALSYKFGKALITFAGHNRDKKSKLMNSVIFGTYARSVKNHKTEFDWLSANEENVQKYIADPLCGYMSSNGFYYEFLKGCNRLYKNKFLKKIRKDMHILIIAGCDDPVGAKGKGPTKLAKMYQKLGIEDVTLKLYEGMRHEILNEVDNKIVYNDILTFLDRQVEPAESLLK